MISKAGLAARRPDIQGYLEMAQQHGISKDKIDSQQELNWFLYSETSQILH